MGEKKGEKKEEKKEEKSNKKKKRTPGKIIKIILLSLISLMILGGVALGGVALAIVNSAPPLDVNQILTLNEPSKIYNDKDELMDDVVTDEKRTVVSIKDMPQNLKDAFVSIEDERFYSHKGIDPRRILGVIYIDIKVKLTKKGYMHGASTMTQQLLKNTLLTSEVTPKRKIQEMYLAMQLEKRLTKDQILEAYLNTIPLGGRAHGVEAAAEQYFNKSVKNLTLLESAYIAGITQSPSYYHYNSDPAKKDPSIYLNRAVTVLNKMYEFNKISKEEYDNAISDIDHDKAVNVAIKKFESSYLSKEQYDNGINDLNKKLQNKSISKEDFDKNTAQLNTKYQSSAAVKAEYDKAMETLKGKKLAFTPASTTSNRLNYEWFSLPAIEQVKKDLKNQYKYNDDEVEALLMYGGLKIYTTMDKNLQETAQKILDDDKNIGMTSKKDGNGIVQPQGSAVIMDYHSGEVKTIIGGRGPQPPRSFNRAAFNGSKSFLKPVGSSIKPLTVYSAALDSKQISAATVVEDSPLPPEIGKLYGNYNPRNYETGSFRGPVTIREAIAASINLVAIKVEHQIGLATGVSYAEKYGLNLDPADKTSIAALSLGELTYGSNTLTMAAAYGTFGNNGMYTEPILYRKVVDKRGMTLLENKPKNRKVLTPQSAYIMYDLLKGPTGPGGTAPNAKFSSMPAVGKTGTSGDKKNFWFTGLTPYYSGAVWLGDDIPKTYNGGLYSSTSAGIWSKIMAEAHKNLQVKDIEMPSGISRGTVCAESGKIPTDLRAKDSRGSRARTDFIIEGTLPSGLCDIHVEAKVNKLNGKLATDFTPKELVETRVFIKKDPAPSAALGEYYHILPKDQDDTKPVVDPVIPPDTTTPPADGTTKPDPTKPTDPTTPPTDPNKPKN